MSLGISDRSEKKVSASVPLPRDREADPRKQGQPYTITSARTINWSGTTTAGEVLASLLSESTPKADCTLPVHHYSSVVATLEWGEGRRRERTKRKGGWQHMGKERRSQQEQSFKLTTSGLIFGINKATCNYEYLLWLITAVYVGNYEASYMIIVYA